MDDHFRIMLGTQAAESSGSSKDIRRSTTRTSFFPSTAYVGSKPGYYYTNGTKGLGYYLDELMLEGNEDRVSALQDGKKRKRIDMIGDEHSDEETNNHGKSSSIVERVKKQLEEESEGEAVVIDVNSLRQILFSFEKKVKKNQMLRMKYPDEPEKFMESEIELAGELDELSAVATSPELYPIIVETGSVNLLLGMISHDNTDISCAVINLMQEFTDPENVKNNELTDGFINSLLDGQVLVLIIQNLSRLDETNDNDAQGVYNSMGVVENMMELRPEVALSVCKETPIIEYLLTRLKSKSFDTNKLYCSEILSILLQSDPQIPRIAMDKFNREKGEKNDEDHSKSDTDGMEMLLEAIAMYRKRDPVSIDEQECIDNLFLCLCTVLMEEGIQSKFLTYEGSDLLIRCLKEQKHAAICSIRAINYAILNNKTACEKFVEDGGFKYIFPVLMGRGLPKSELKKMNKHKSNGSASFSKKDIEDAVLSICSQFCLQLHDSTKHDAASRLLGKFLENEGEKLERCIEIYLNLRQQLAATELQIQRTIESLEQSGMIDDLEEFASEENVYAQRLEGGLYSMQQASIIIAFACIFDPTNKSLHKSQIKLASDGASMIEVLEVLREATANIGDDQTNLSDLSSTTSSSLNNDHNLEDKKRQKVVFTSWCAALATIISNDA